MVQATETKTWRVKPDTQSIESDIIEVWESMNGDLWFISELDYAQGGVAFGYARLYSMPQFAEWGGINRAELQENPLIWQVSRENWGNINSYEDGLLVQISPNESNR